MIKSFRKVANIFGRVVKAAFHVSRGSFLGNNFPTNCSIFRIIFKFDDLTSPDLPGNFGKLCRTALQASRGKGFRGNFEKFNFLTNFGLWEKILQPIVKKLRPGFKNDILRVRRTRLKKNFICWNEFLKKFLLPDFKKLFFGYVAKTFLRSVENSFYLPSWTFWQTKFSAKIFCFLNIFGLCAKIFECGEEIQQVFPNCIPRVQGRFSRKIVSHQTNIYFDLFCTWAFFSERWQIISADSS